MLLGKTDKEIAFKLNIAINTVQAHLKRIYKKPARLAALV
jgi:DNA-binding CsgD family transcriptional regulator